MKVTSVVFTILLVLLACLCVACLAFAALSLLVVPTDTVTTVPTETIHNPTSTLTPVAPGSPIFSLSEETLAALEASLVPENDPLDLARRLGGLAVPVPATVEPEGLPYQVGDVKKFWISNNDGNSSRLAEATLAYIGEVTYFWHESTIPVDSRKVQALVEEFESNGVPIVRRIFGSEWSPGIDGDPRIYIVYASDLGRQVAGLFSSVDELHPLVHPYSNAHEMFFLGADYLSLDENFAYSVLVHEYQHMVHWNTDRNEDTWLNEGFSELASLLAGDYGAGPDSSYAGNTDIQLNNWPDSGDTIPNYGGSFLLTSYFFDRFGEQATRNLVADPENGFQSIDTVLANLDYRDGIRGRQIDGDDLFQDFAAALYLNDSGVEDGRFSFTAYPAAPEPAITEVFRNCDRGPLPREVNQYGIDYIRIACDGRFNLQFSGNEFIPLLPVDPYSGNYAFWSNQGDSSDMTLTRSFDFTGYEGPLTLDYRTWFDIEEDYDYVFLSASTDGQQWQILDTPSGTNANPTGNSYGAGYTGRSIGWIRERVDLSRFAGQQVELRFDYVTDSATHADGLMLDDIRIPETGYFTDFEEDDGGWKGTGFVRIANALPQTFRVTLIRLDGKQAAVEYLELSEENQGLWELTLNGRQEAILVVSGSTRYSHQPAHYDLEFVPLEPGP